MGKILLKINELRESRTGVLCVVSLALFTDLLVYGVIVPILPMILKRVGRNSDSDSGILFAAYAIGLFIFTPIFGIMSDRLHNRKVPMLLGLMALGVCTLGFIFTSSFAFLIFCRISQGISAAATWVVGLAMISDCYQSNIGFAMGIVNSANTFGFFVGPLVGGFLAEYVSLESPFYLCASLAFIDFIGRLFVKSPKVGNQEFTAERLVVDSECAKGSDVLMTGSSAMSNHSGWRVVFQRKIILISAVTILGSAVMTALESSVSIHLEGLFGLSASMVGLAFMALVIPNIVMALICGYLSDKYPAHRVIFVGMVLNFSTPILIGNCTDIISIIICFFAFGTTASIMMTPVMPEIAKLIRHSGVDSFAQAYAVFNGSYSIGLMIGPIVAGYLTKYLGFPWSMSFFGILIAVYCPFFLIFYELL